MCTVIGAGLALSIALSLSLPVLAQVKTETSPPGTLRGKTRMVLTSFHTAPNKTVIQAVGLPLTSPVDVGARCNKLLIVPLAYAFLTTTNNDQAMARITQVFPHIPATFEIRVGVQSAWSDSQTNAFSLTRAYLPTLPSAPPNARFEKTVVRSLTTLSPTGTLIAGIGDLPLIYYE